MCDDIKELQSDEVTISVSKTTLGNVKTKAQKISIRPFVTDTAKVGVKVGRLISLGNYENVKVEIFISSPAYVEEIVDVFKQVKTLASDLLDAEVDEIEKQLGK